MPIGMRSLRRALWISGLVLGCSVPITLRAGPALPVPGAWKLDSETVFLRGCYPPCRCALFAQPGVTGTFVLGGPVRDEGWLVYPVREVEWEVPGDEPHRVRGYGEYWLEDADEPRERLVLTLEIDEEEPAIFQSKNAIRTSDSDSIIATVSVSGMECFDTVFEIRAVLDDAAPPLFVRSDCNADGDRDIADPVFSLQSLFNASGRRPPCLASCDTNADGRHDVSDAIYALAFLFQGGPAPPPPFPSCGRGANGGDLACETYAPCG